MACLQGLLVKKIAFGYQDRNMHWKGKIIYEIFMPYYHFIHTFKKHDVSVCSLKVPFVTHRLYLCDTAVNTFSACFLLDSLFPIPPSPNGKMCLCTYFCFLGILTFSGLFFFVISFPFFNHLNLSAGYSEVVSHRSTSFWPTATSWFFISFNLGGTAKEIKERDGD